jgi:predicted esterase
MWTAAAEKLGVVLVAPKGATRLASGRYGWEPQFPTDNAQLDWAAAEASVDRAVEAARGACHNIDQGRVVLAGFSQGGYVALRLLHDHPARYAGVITFVTVYHRDGIDSWNNVPPKRAYLVSGADDTLCPQSRDARDDLTAAGFDVRFDEIDGMSHEVPPEYEDRQVRALRFVLGGRDP